MTSETADSTWAAYELPLVEFLPAGAAAENPRPAKADEQLLLRHGAWFCSLRWLVIAALVTASGVAWAGRGLLPTYGIRLDWAWPLAVAAVLVVLNGLYFAIARAAAAGARFAPSPLAWLWTQILLDLTVLTVVIHYAGSLETYAPSMYLFHVVLACIFLPRGQSLLVLLSAMGMYAVCLLLEGSAVIPPRSVLALAIFPGRNSLPRSVVAWYFGSVAFISGTVWYLASRLADALRQRDEELAAINRRLVASIEERARHMLRTTHQLKAPFAAIHANAQLLLGGYCGPIADRPKAVIEQIAARCEKLSREITEMLQLANLRSEAQSPPPAILTDLAVVVRSCLAGLRPQADRRGIVVDEDLAPAAAQIVPDHGTMMIENVVSNAINYSRDGQHVAVACRPAPDGGARVVVRDEGIGIPAEKLPRIFEDYFRTTEAVQHNKASTGLGLAILRQAALAGRVRVRVESAPQRGTIFSLDFPAFRDDSGGPK